MTILVSPARSMCRKAWLCCVLLRRKVKVEMKAAEKKRDAVGRTVVLVCRLMLSEMWK